MPAMVRALVAVAPDSLKPACLATATTFCAQLMSRHSAARMNGSNRKMSLEPVGMADYAVTLLSSGLLQLRLHYRQSGAPHANMQIKYPGSWMFTE